MSAWTEYRHKQMESVYAGDAAWESMADLLAAHRRAMELLCVVVDGPLGPGCEAFFVEQFGERAWEMMVAIVAEWRGEKAREDK